MVFWHCVCNTANNEVQKNPSLPVKRWKHFLKVCGKTVREETGLSADLMVARTRVLVEIIWIVVVLEGPSWTKIL